MFEINRHKFFLVQLLKDIYTDPELAVWLGFKGGTALMFFYDLPRFSTDLDFDLLNIEKEEETYNKVKKIVMKHGAIFDEAKKFYGPLIVLDYGKSERKLKIEISNRNFGSSYEIKNLLGFSVKVMVAPDMFAHKLCALLDRVALTNRDIFDVWFFLNRQHPINRLIVETRMGVSLETHIENCISQLTNMKPRHILDGLGELMNSETKHFVKTRLLAETISLLQFYQRFPITNH